MGTFDPKSLMILFVPIILKIRSAATIPIWSVLNLSAIWRNGRNSICDIWINKKIVPSEIEPPAATFRPPNQTNNPSVIDEEISATGKKMELYHTVFNQASLCFSFIEVNFLNSISSRWNNCTICIPVNCSWINEFKLATWSLTSSNAVFIDFWKSLVA